MWHSIDWHNGTGNPYSLKLVTNQKTKQRRAKNTPIDNVVGVYHHKSELPTILQNPTIKTVSYTLQPERALFNKLDACNRVNHLEIVYTEGGIRVYCTV
jgi:hypothetical protein